MDIDRLEIKSKAKKLIKNNLWTICKPYLFIYFITYLLTFGIGFLVFGNDYLKINQIENTFLTTGVSIILSPLSVGLVYYVLLFIRGKKPSLKDVFKFFPNILAIVASYFLMNLLISIGTVLLIVPGIILSFAFILIPYIIADGEKGIIEPLKESYNMMKGHKMDFFLFVLSFIGWFIIIILTFLIAAVWVIPYFSTATGLYYEEVKKLYNKK